MTALECLRADTVLETIHIQGQTPDKYRNNNISLVILIILPGYLIPFNRHIVHQIFDFLVDRPEEPPCLTQLVHRVVLAGWNFNQGQMIILSILISPADI